MPERNLTYRITARDDASAVTSKIAAAAKRDFGQVQDELDDTATAGQRMARALERVADDLTSELDRTESAADSLARALGPEFVAKVGQGGVDKVVTDLRKAGLTFDDIEQDADELAAAIKRVEDVSERTAGGTRQAFDDVDAAAGRSAATIDKNRSVVANFAGNAVQDLPGVSGAFGAMNVAAGQFAEYAAEGDINLKKMIGQVGGMVAVGAVIGVVASEMGKAAENARKNREQIADWVDGMREGKSAVDAMVDSFREAGKVEFVLPLIGDDITDDLAKLGLSIEDFGRLTQASDEQVNAWRASVQASGGDGEALGAVLMGLGIAQENLARATEQSALMDEVFGTAVDDTTRATEDNTQAVEENQRALEDRYDAVREQTGAELDLEQAHLRTREAMQRYTEALNDSEASAEDREGAAFDLQEAIMAEGDAARDSAETTARAQGRASTAVAEGSAAQIWQLGQVAGTFAPGSPLRVWLDEYIDRLGSIPRTVKTDITVSGNAAGPLVGARAKGGPVTAGAPYVVGEEGPELFVPGQSGTVIPNGTAIAASAQPIAVTVVLDGQTLLSSLVKVERSSGPLPITVRAVA